ncbi:transcriptional regulator NikR, CopG family [Ignisphaera aggregans DSM 17230]|uniref:Putative nickel-responsive regulator n=1 Tax=Ignisphaera aggregans (strain DSM 17230 / JCM 13409 / AQ1.S1) TaxID=583356 RepID=E0SQC5_IGNAA|nr:transcriptional regulator NikR, CopG family [Ignisphaera aggregans DSM 17230]
MERRGIKFGVYIPEDIAMELEDIMKSMGIDNKSKVIQEALRVFVLENKWYFTKSVAGSIAILYNHDVDEVDEKLTDIQHEYIDIIKASMHVHLDEKKCMLLIAVKGESSKIKELIGKLHTIRGVLLIRHVLLSLED